MLTHQEIEAGRLELVKEVEENVGSIEEVNRIFGENSFGRHEVIHTSSIFAENWEAYILSHNAVVIDQELYHRAYKIVELMNDFYQKVATHGD